MPPVPKNGWAYADCYYGDGWSIAYRVFDAQFWGVPQRRRRIYLVLNLTGQRAGSVLFEREGLRGHFAESGATWQATAGDAEDCTGAADREGTLFQPMSLMEENWSESDVKNALRAGESKVSHAVVCKTWDARGNGDGDVCSTVTGDHENRVTDYTSVVIEGAPVYCLQGNGIDRGDTAGCNGKGWKEDICYTLNTIDRHAVTFAMQGFGDYKESGVASGLKARDYKDATDLVCGVDCRNMTEYPELYPTLQAKPNGGQSLNFSGAVRVRYIVRRLTPTECARLQGFLDNWGHPVRKEELTEEEYDFWIKVRNTHAVINGKAVKEYTKDQMLTWYNKLHTDSAEYKMWGNGIALPPALYVMEGIAETERMTI